MVAGAVGDGVGGEGGGCVGQEGVVDGGLPQDGAGGDMGVEAAAGSCGEQGAGAGPLRWGR